MSVHKITQWALPYCKKFHTYIDVGAHNGDTSVPFITKFARVYAFEPNPTTNQLIPASVKMFPYALGDVEMENVLIIPDNGFNQNTHGSTTRFRHGGIRQYSCTQKTLDSFEFSDVSLIKIDVEGGELGVVKGAVNTIVNWKPVVMFENKQGKNNLVVDFFRDLRYNVKKYKSDWIAWYEE
ncbi:MAG: hypothetical protein CMA64_05485 [Euryarchaeota archaeon]|nr:hypothetical protein [Euryarchaeota archaeon]|tara:strand:+ start:250 stop:792 length:543 start_codon:yes stop_codon:yes gene_type:complete